MSNPRFLHVANGTSTTQLIEAAGIPGALSIWADVLYEGPVPAAVSDEELLQVRARHLSGAVANAHAAGVSDPSLDPVNDLRRWRAAIDGHERYDELILWYEHDLFDQLNLIQLLSCLPQRVPGEKVVSLVCVGSFPGRPDFKGLGELSPDQLRSLLGTRTRVTEEQLSLAQRAWAAFREPTPEALDALRGDDTSALPFLLAAVARFLQEYPWTTDGLSRSERRLLGLASSGGTTLIDALPRMHEGEDAYYVTDLSLARMAEALSGTAPALLTRTPGGTSQASLAPRVALTTAGAAVLAGQQDRLEVCGIDQWLGGVHLYPDGPDWRWDPVHERVIRAVPFRGGDVSH